MSQRTVNVHDVLERACLLRFASFMSGLNVGCLPGCCGNLARAKSTVSRRLLLHRPHFLWLVWRCEVLFPSDLALGPGHLLWLLVPALCLSQLAASPALCLAVFWGDFDAALSGSTWKPVLFKVCASALPLEQDNFFFFYHKFSLSINTTFEMCKISVLLGIKINCSYGC